MYTAIFGAIYGLVIDSGFANKILNQWIEEYIIRVELRRGITMRNKLINR